MVGTRRAMVKREASRRGWKATFAGVISAGAVGTCVVVGAPLLITLGVGIAGVGFTSTRAAQWLKYRGEHGLKF